MPVSDTFPTHRVRVVKSFCLLLTLLCLLSHKQSDASRADVCCWHSSSDQETYDLVCSDQLAIKSLEHKSLKRLGHCS